MERKHNIPLFFLLIASGIGLLLRYHLVVPVAGLRYTYWLHAHSHTMFLGWVTNALYIAFVYAFIGRVWPARYVRLFWFIQALLVGMLISFPLQGYGFFSIALSTVHTLGMALFCFWFFRDTRAENSMTVWFARRSLLFFLISSVGPFALAPIMALGLRNTEWYNHAIYYYLHFQYNGVFIFGILALFYRVLDIQRIPYRIRESRRFGRWIFWACIPAYLLSVLWARPPVWIHWIGVLSAVAQLAALYFFLQSVPSWRSREWQKFNATVRLLCLVVLMAFILKLVLQMASAHADVAKIAYENRPFVIAYLHLVLIGVVTLFLIAYYRLEGWIVTDSHTSLFLVLVGFMSTELTMVLMPIFAIAARHAPLMLMLFSVLMFVGFSALLISALRRS